MDTVSLYYRMRPDRIVVLKSILEGHEGLLVFRTLDPQTGIIHMLVSPDFLREVQSLIADLSREIWLEAVQPDETR